MNIREAKEKYRREKEKCVNVEFRSMAESLANSNADTNQPIKNSNYLHALYLTELMFERTCRSIGILSGPGFDGFLETLEESFTNAVSRIARTGGKVRILLLGQEVPAFILRLKNMYRGVFEIHHAKEAEGTRVRHFIVCDKNKVRVENIHETLTEESDINDIQADVYLNNRNIAKVFNTFMDTCLKER